jgi:hypothetical protein
MKKRIKSEMDDELRREYDLRQLLKNGVRCKHYKAMRQGYTIKIHKSDGTTVVKHVKPVIGAVILEPDVLEYFPDSEAVNKALRSFIALIPNKSKTVAQKEQKTRYSKLTAVMPNQ